MTLEMVETDHEVVVGKMSAYDVVVQMGMVAHGDAYLIVFVHDVDGEILGKAVAVYDLPVIGRIVAHVVRIAAIGGVVFYNGTVNVIDEILDELRFEIVGIAALAGTYFHGHTPLGFHA